MKFRGEFYHLKIRPEYPRTVEAVAIACLHFDRSELRLYFERPPGSQWVASLWIVDQSCEVDLAVVLKEDQLDFIEGYCSHGDFCPTVEELKQTVLHSGVFATLREDIGRELMQRELEDQLTTNDSPPGEVRIPPDTDNNPWR